MRRVGTDIADRFLMCEAKTLPPEDGAPLVLCAFTDAISVSVPSETVWDLDSITEAVVIVPARALGGLSVTRVLDRLALERGVTLRLIEPGKPNQNA